MWQNTNGISMGQGKYEIDILNRFRMMDYKAMTTPMASNLKLLSDASSELVDAFDVSSNDWVLDAPDEYKTRYLLCCEQIHVPNRYETCSPDGCKACSEVPKGYS